MAKDFSIDLNMNPGFERELQKEPEMQRFLEKVASEIATEIERTLPYPGILGGLTVTSEAVLEADGYEGVTSVEGPGWHLWEFGTSNHPAKPAIRPAAQSILSQYDGRLGESS